MKKIIPILLLVLVSSIQQISHSHVNTSTVIDDQVEFIVEESVENGVAITNEVNSEELECLAKAIYWEARNQSIEGKIAVGYVVLNRVNAGIWKNTVCEVVYQDCQFSWVCNGNAKKNPWKKQNMNEQIAWKKSISIAHELLSGSNEIEDITRGATYFHARYVRPHWSKWRKIERTVRIDDHIFYRLRTM